MLRLTTRAVVEVKGGNDYGGPKGPTTISKCYNKKNIEAHSSVLSQSCQHCSNDKSFNNSLMYPQGTTVALTSEI